MAIATGTALAGTAALSGVAGYGLSSDGGGGLVDASSTEREYSPTYRPRSTEVDARQSSQQFSFQEGDYAPSVIIDSPDASTTTVQKKTQRQRQRPTQRTRAEPDQRSEQDRSEGISNSTLIWGAGIAGAAYVATQVL